ncbi:TPA: hypothetical protein QCU33_005263 [Bacillus cereus]|nr:hypothetical protein [Bacillus cereus]
MIKKESNLTVEIIVIILFLLFILFVWWTGGPRKMIRQLGTEKEYMNGLQLLFSRDNWFTEADKTLMIIPAAIFNIFKLISWMLLLPLTVGKLIKEGI